MLVYGYSGGFEHAGPIDAVGFKNIFGDDVLGHRPELLKQFTIRVSEC